MMLGCTNLLAGQSAPALPRIATRHHMPVEPLAAVRLRGETSRHPRLPLPLRAKLNQRARVARARPHGVARPRAASLAMRAARLADAVLVTVLGDGAARDAVGAVARVATRVAAVRALGRHDSNQG